MSNLREIEFTYYKERINVWVDVNKMEICIYFNEKSDYGYKAMEKVYYKTVFVKVDGGLEMFNSYGVEYERLLERKGYNYFKNVEKRVKKEVLTLLKKEAR